MSNKIPCQCELHQCCPQCDPVAYAREKKRFERTKRKPIGVHKTGSKFSFELTFDDLLKLSYLVNEGVDRLHGHKTYAESMAKLKKDKTHRKLAVNARRNHRACKQLQDVLEAAVTKAIE